MAQSLRRQILVVTAVILVPIIGILFWAAYLTYRQQVIRIEAGTRTMAVTVSAYVNRTLAVADGVGGVIVAEPSIQALDADAAAGALHAVLANPLFRNAVLADPTGRPLRWAAPPDPQVEGLMPAGWLATVASGGTPEVGALLGAVGAPAHAIPLAYPIERDGRLVGVLGLLVRVEALQSGLAALPLPEPVVVTIVDGHGIVVARSRDAAPYVGGPAAPGAERRAPGNGQPAIVRSPLDGVARIVGTVTMRKVPWVVSVAVPTGAAWAATLPIYRRNFSISIGVTILILCIEFVFARRWLRAVSHLERVAGRVKDGDLTTPERQAMPTSELERLQEAFASMVAGLHRAQAEIAAQVEEERRMRTELESLQQQVIRQERLAAIGVLVAGLAHELNNPLQAVLGLAELLIARGDLRADALSDVTLITRESQRASAIVRNLKRFGQPQTTEPVAVRLHEVIASTIELRRHDIESQGIELAVDDRATAAVMGVFTELQQVLLNVVINAEQAIGPDGAGPRRIEIRTRDGQGRVRIEVEDTGPGVAPGDVAKLFQPFFTTKPVGEGTGLGLSVSYGIIQSHGGDIGYRPSPAGGAIFYVDLPAALTSVP